MCGLCGGASTYLVDGEIEMIKQLMVLNRWRGSDSTGMFDYIANPKALKPKKKAPTPSPARYWKSPSDALTFAQGAFTDAAEYRWDKGRVQAIAVHCRAATKGEVSIKNAHPFYFSGDKAPLIGMHNGTIFGEFKHSKEHETDSEALYRNIYEYGIEETLENLASLYNVAYALVWMNLEDRAIYFLRNKERPLNYLQGTGSIYWASEKRMLAYAGGTFIKSQQAPDIREFQPGLLYKLPVGSVKLETINIKIPEKKGYVNVPFREDYFTEGAASRSPSSRGSSAPARSFVMPEGMQWVGMVYKKEDFIRGYNETTGWMANDTIERIEALGKEKNKTVWSVQDGVTGLYFTAFMFGVLTRKRVDAKLPWYNPDQPMTERTITPFQVPMTEPPPTGNVVPLRQSVLLPEPKEMPALPENLNRNNPDNPLFQKKGGGERLTHKYNNTRCTYDEYVRRLNVGCAWCNCHVPETEHIHWCNDHDWLCAQCSADAKDPNHGVHTIFKYHEVGNLIDDQFFDADGNIIEQTKKHNWMN